MPIAVVHSSHGYGAALAVVIGVIVSEPPATLVQHPDGARGQQPDSTRLSRAHCLPRIPVGLVNPALMLTSDGGHIVRNKTTPAVLRQQASQRVRVVL